jgi:hypothetical protein
MGSPSTSLSATAPVPPRLVGISYGIFDTPVNITAPVQSTVPANYNLYTSNNVSPTTSVGNPGDWYFMTTSDSVVVYQKTSQWNAYTVITGGSIYDLTQVYNDIATLNSNVATVSASVSVETTARVNADEVLASQITTVNASLGTSVASINQTLSTLSTTSYVQSQISTTLSAATAAASALVSSEATARATADSAISSTVTSLTSTVSGNTANISTILSTYATTTYVTSTVATTLSSAETYTNAQISTEATTRATADTALSTSVTSLTATVTSNYTTLSANITTVSTTSSTAIAALASTVTTLTATVSSNNSTLTASLTTEADVRATADGNLSANYSITLNTGGQVTGMQLNSSSGGGTTTSTINFEAGVFNIYNGVSGGVAPFSVSGGNVYIGSAYINSVSAGAIQTGTLSAATITLSGTSGQLGIITSPNYVTGTSGLYIDGTGKAEFQDVLIRGTLQSGSVVSTGTGVFNPGNPLATFPTSGYLSVIDSTGWTAASGGTYIWESATKFYGWGAASAGFSQSTFGQSNMNFIATLSGGCSPASGSYIIFRIVAQINGTGTIYQLNAFDYSVNASGSLTPNLTATLNLPSLNSTDYVTFGVYISSPSSAGTVGTIQLSVISLNL